ncbi:MAG: Imm7 family immunity protein [Pseudonocardiaceae bacterium]
MEVGADDPDADALAERIGGRASVRFSNDTTVREYDAVSDQYVGQAKPANFQMGSAFRNQAKATFETAVRTGRTPYFHFDGPPALSAQLPGSWGILYERSDDMPNPPDPTEFRVRVLARGQVSERKDPFLSPCRPTIED